MNETILIIDDTPTNLQLLVRFLAETGFHILIAEDGPGALEQLSRLQPDLILLDVTMPGMDGFETCRQIKSQASIREIPVIFLTARSEIADKLLGFEVGGVDYITKPIQRDEVIARVNTHLTLRRQQRELQRLLAERERFMKIAAHDLRNLLAILSGYSELGLSDPNVEDKQKALRQTQEAGQRMQALVDEFLSVQVLRAEQGRREAFELDTVVAQILEQSAYAAQSKGITIARHLPPGPLRVVGRRAHTHQILTNYISNALKYSPPGTVVRLTARRDGRFWRLEVQDQGPGIPVGERERLFTEFPKISNKPTGKETSVGLGLAIVRSLAEAQGGGVGADFPQAGGSNFWVDLPAENTELAAAS